MMGDLSENFNLSEFKCRCGCDNNEVDPAFIAKLQRARTDADVVFTVTSGCRCAKHNAAVRGAISSDHLVNDDFGVVCQGADIHCVRDDITHENTCGSASCRIPAHWCA